MPLDAPVMKASGVASMSSASAPARGGREGCRDATVQLHDAVDVVVVHRLGAHLRAAARDGHGQVRADALGVEEGVEKLAAELHRLLAVQALADNVSAPL